MKLSKWKQKSPQNQLVAIVMSMEGDIDNCKDGTIPFELVYERMIQSFQEIHLLLPFLSGKESWDAES